MRRALLLILFAGLLIVLIVGLAQRGGEAQSVVPSPVARERSVVNTPAATGGGAQSVVPSPVANTPAATDNPYPPVMSWPTDSTGRIGSTTPLSASVPRYTKFEIAYAISTTATNVYFPYDPAAPYGESGVTVDMLVTDPHGLEKLVPCFYYQPVDADLTPVGRPDWRCRYSPESIGMWRYRMRLVDSNGPTESTEQTFTVTASSQHGFVRVSPTDSHYFEFDDGTPFLAPLVNVESGVPLSSLDRIRTNIPKWGQNGVRFVRWFPTGEGGNYDAVLFGDDLRVSWGFGDASTVPEADPGSASQFTFSPYYYTAQTVTAVEGARYRLSFRAKVTGSKVLHPELGSSTIEIRASDWQAYSIETTSDDTELTVWFHDGDSEDDKSSGTIRLQAITLQRDETGRGDWGPNLLARGAADTYQYMDQVGAARLDEIMRLSEQYGVYHKLTLFNRNDQILGRLNPAGAVAADWDANNIYSQDGAVPRWLQKAYARYFVARWSYSTALHSLEFANENLLTTESYEAAYSVLGYIKSIAPRHILLSNSFWGYFVEPYWTSPKYGPLMDYTDKHWYARWGFDSPELVSTIVDDSAANVRECARRFAEYRARYALDKPVVRGETGVWQPGTVVRLDLGAGAATYYHKQVWAQMGDQCAGEWNTDYLDQHDLWGDYQRYAQFLQDEPLTNGHYADIGSDTGTIAIVNTTGTARAWGKFDAAAGRGLLWIDNASDTWKRVADGLSVMPVTASLEIDGLPNGTYQVTWFDTADGVTTVTAQTVSNGQLTLSVSALAHDVAVKFKKP